MKKYIPCLVLVFLMATGVSAAGGGNASLSAKLVQASFYEPIPQGLSSDMWFDFREDREAEYVYVVKGRNLMALNFKTLTLKSANGDKLSPQEYEIDNYYTKVSRDGRFATFAVKVKNAAQNDGAGLSGQLEAECYEMVVTNQCAISVNESHDYEFKGLKVAVKLPQESDQPGFWSVETKSEGKLLGFGATANGKSVLPSGHAETPCSGNGANHCWYFKFPEGAAVKLTAITPTTTSKKRVVFGKVSEK